MADFDSALDQAANLDLPAELAAPDPVDPHPERLVWLDDYDDEGVRQAWARRDGEDEVHYALFQYYCSLPSPRRTFTAVAKHYGRDSANLSKVARENDWKSRVSAWDDERNRVYQLEVFEELQDMGRRHGPILKDAIEAIAIPLQVMAERMRADPEQVMEELGEKNLTQLHAMSIKSARALPNMMQTERLVRGLPTEITANIHSGKVEHVHTPDLSEVASILQGLHDAGAIGIVGNRIVDTTEVVDAEDEPLHPDGPDPETDGLPSS
jgi:hypothetical protein